MSNNAPVNCNDTRYKCGQLIPSACIPFTGTLPSYIDPSQFPCNVNVDDVINAANTTITGILAGIDYSSLNYGSLTPPSVINSATLHQLELNTLNGLQSQLTVLQQDFNSLNIATENITIDLQCLTPNSNPCSATPNVYTLYFILSTMLSRICLLSSEVATLQQQVASL